jgi:transcriptional regulator with XRE-family HTH domain
MRNMRIRQVKEIDVDISERIKQARIDISNRKSLAAICDEVGVSTTYWYDIEKNKIRGALSIENLRKIEKALGIDLGVAL